MTAHNEGRLLHRTLRCLETARQIAAGVSIDTELIVVADNPSDETTEYLERSPITLERLLEVENRSVGMSRMDGLSVASGRYATIVDGDDLVSTNWLSAAFDVLRASTPETIAHPEFTVVFGAKRMLCHHKGSGQEDFHKEGVLDRNPWTSTIAADVKTMLSIGYDVGQDGLGYEDWYLLMELLARGGRVDVVPGTCKFYRVKTSDSRFNEQQAGSALIPRSSLFGPTQFLKYLDSVSPAKLPRRGGAKSSLRHARSALAARAPSLLPAAEGVYESAHLVAARMAQSRDFPDWLISAAHDVHRFEPEIFPNEATLGSRRYEANPPAKMGSAYARMCREIERLPTHLLLVPWLKRGGADLEALNYVQVLAASAENSVVVMATAPDSESPWQERLSSSVQFVDFGQMSGHLARELRINLLANVLVQWSPAVIHNLNSREGWEVFARFGPALSASALYASVFCADRSPSGQMVGYPFEYLPSTLSQLSGLFADNRHVLESLDEIYSFGNMFTDVHFQPAPEAHERVSNPHEPLRVLWAGRLDRQRRPDILGAVASACAERGLAVEFDFYGSTMLDRRAPRLPRMQNLSFKGEFNQLTSIDTAKYDLFLNTSEWDGMPNVLLEATALGLPIISSSVGGIPELIEHGASGYLVTPFDDVSGYVEAIVSVLANRDVLSKWVAQARARVNERHTWEAFEATVRRVPGYLSSDSQIEVDE